MPTQDAIIVGVCVSAYGTGAGSESLGPVIPTSPATPPGNEVPRGSVSYPLDPSAKHYTSKGADTDTNRPHNTIPPRPRARRRIVNLRYYPD